MSNSITVPTGIWQLPFFHASLPEAITFGGIGSIIGHELTHAFDNTGRQYDELGNKRNWWSNSSLDNFENKTDCFKNQYSEFYADFSTDSSSNFSPDLIDDYPDLVSNSSDTLNS